MTQALAEDGCIAQLVSMGFDPLHYQMNDFVDVCKKANNDITEAINILISKDQDTSFKRQHNFEQKQIDTDEHKDNHQPCDVPYKSVVRGLIKCNGDCQSQFAKMIEDCVNHQSVDYLINQYHDIIRNTFKYYDNPLRQSLLILIKKKNCRVKYEYYYNDIENTNYLINDVVSIRKIAECFREMVLMNDKDILQNIANQTCNVPVRSLIEEIEQGQRMELNKLQNKYDTLQQMLQIGREEKMNEFDDDNGWLIKKIKALTVEIEKEKTKIAESNNMKYFYDRTNGIKQHRNYLKMKQCNKTELTDLEILAVLFYCDVDQYCYKMRKSHREQELNSCEWKNLYYHLCVAIDKMHRVFHLGNNKWLKRCKLNDLLSGNTVSFLNDKGMKCLKQETVTSFTTDASVAEEFAGSQGMILVIENGIQALYDGKLRGASVKWLSAHDAEDEILILPTTFSNFRYLFERERIDKGFTIPEEKHNMYITKYVQSTNITYFSSDINKQNDGLSAWFPFNSPDYDYKLTMQAIDCFAYLLREIVGHFKHWKCKKCGVMSRFLEFAGNISDATIECPSCRTYIFRSHSSNNEYGREFKCYNPSCKPMNGKITRSDLIRSNDTETYGLKCRKCKQYQKKAYLDAVVNHPPTLNKKVEEILDCLEKCIILHYRCTIGKEVEFTEEECKMDKSKYRDGLRKIVIFMYSTENQHATLDDILSRFGTIIWKWASSIKSVKVMLDAYKYGYTELLDKEIINESNNIQINENNAEDVGRMVANGISQIDLSDIDGQQISNVAMGFFRGFN